MSVRRIPPTDRTAPRTGPTRYDLLLAAIPVPLLTGVFVAFATELALQTCVAAGSLGSATLVGYGLFSAAPTDDPSTDSFAPGDD